MNNFRNKAIDYQLKVLKLLDKYLQIQEELAEIWDDGEAFTFPGNDKVDGALQRAFAALPRDLDQLNSDIFTVDEEISALNCEQKEMQAMRDLKRLARMPENMVKAVNAINKVANQPKFNPNRRESRAGMKRRREESEELLEAIGPLFEAAKKVKTLRSSDADEETEEVEQQMALVLAANSRSGSSEIPVSANGENAVKDEDSEDSEFPAANDFSEVDGRDESDAGSVTL